MNRWGDFLELDEAAQHHPTLRSLFGNKAMVTEYQTWMVLGVMARSRDAARLQSHAHHHLNKPKQK